MSYTKIPLEPRPLAGAAPEPQPLTPRPVGGEKSDVQGSKPKAEEPPPASSIKLAVLFLLLALGWGLATFHASAQWTTNALSPSTNGGVALAFSTNGLSASTNGGVALAFSTNGLSASTNGGVALGFSTNALASAATWTWSTYGNNPTNFPSPNAGLSFSGTNGLAFYVNMPANPANEICGWYTNAPNGMVTTIGSYPVWYTNNFTGAYIYTNTSNHHLVTYDTDFGMTNGIYGPNTWDLNYDSSVVVAPNLPIQFYTVSRF